MKKARIKDLPTGIGVTKNSNGSTVYWMVRLGKKFTGGKPVVKHFTNLTDARTWIFGNAQQEKAEVGSMIDLKERAGTAAFGLTAAELNEAAAAFKRLKDAKLSLTEAINFAIKHTRPEGGEMPLSDAITALVESKRDAGCGVRHLQGLVWSLEMFAKSFPKSPVHEIQKQDIINWLKGRQVSLKSKANHLRDLNILFNFALSNKWTAANPCQDIQKPVAVDSEITVLSPDEVEKLLGATLDAFVPGVAIKVFAGLRSSELLDLDWSQVKEDEIIVTGKKAKTRQRRVVTITPNLARWLTPYRAASGPVVPLDIQHYTITRKRDHSEARNLTRIQTDSPRRSWAWHRQMQAIEAAAGMELPPNVLRHGFGSYHFAKNKNENLTAAEMGNSPAMVFRHYRAVVSAKDAEKFWEISPPTKPVNMVGFAA